MLRMKTLAFAAALIPMTRDSNTDHTRAPAAVTATVDVDAGRPPIPRAGTR